MMTPIGRPGDWYAKWGDENIPCIHRYFLKGMHYCAPVDTRPGQGSKWERYVEEIRKGRVVLTRSSLLPNGNFKRDGYIALYKVANVEVKDGHLHFDLKDIEVRFR